MINKNNSNDPSLKNNNQTEENIIKEEEPQKMNVNPDPRANENVKDIPFKKERGVGSEITDGEAG